MRAQPDLTVMIPAHAPHAAQAVAATDGLDRPVYLRLERIDREIPTLVEPFRVGGASIVGDGEDLAIVAIGSSVEEGLIARESLAAEGVSATVAVVSTFNPSPVRELESLFERVPVVITVEAHLPNGALRSFVAETIAEAGCACRLVSHAVERLPRGISGSREFLYSTIGSRPRTLSRRRSQPSGPGPAGGDGPRQVSMELTSIVLPVHDQEAHIRSVVEAYTAALEAADFDFELLLVTNACRDRSPAICDALAASDARIRHLPSEVAGWGAAVRCGLNAATGDHLCYTNSARTTPEILTLLLLREGIPWSHRQGE